MKPLAIALVLCLHFPVLHWSEASTGNRIALQTGRGFILIQTLGKCKFGDSPNTFVQKAGFGKKKIC